MTGSLPTESRVPRPLSVALPVVILVTPLVLWRVLYPWSDWAALALVPLVIGLFVGIHRPLASVLRAKAIAVVRADSPIARFAMGRVRAAAQSTLFVVTAVFVLAWQALEASTTTALVLLALALAASALVEYMPRSVLGHVQDSVHQYYGIALGTAVAAVALPVLAWINWGYLVHPEELRSLELHEAVSFWVEERLPSRRGAIAEVLAWAYASEAVRIWLVANYGLGSVWALLYSVYLALVAVLVARSSAAVSYLLQRHRAHRRTEGVSGSHGEGVPPAGSAKTASRAFWGTIAVLAIGSMAAAIIGIVATPAPTVEATPTQLERMLSQAARSALDRMAPKVDAQLAEIYAPVYDGIAAYADFHYSIKGEYTELFLTVAGRMEASLQERLFDGFEEAFEKAAGRLDRQFVTAYESALDDQVRELLAAQRPDAVLGPATQLVLGGATERAKVSIPVATAASAAGGGGVKALMAGVAKKLGATIAGKVAAKTAAKTALKGAGVLGGAGTGVAACAWGGPWAIACGVVGGVGGWLLADAVIVNLDEAMNREDFEAELRSLVDGHRLAVRERLMDALKAKSREMDRLKESAGFRLGDVPG